MDIRWQTFVYSHSNLHAVTCMQPHWHRGAPQGPGKIASGALPAPQGPNVWARKSLPPSGVVRADHAHPPAP